MDWADLPEELLNLVLSNLLPKDRKTFGLVCRSWNAITNGSPWLMFYNRVDWKCRFVQSNDFLDMDFPEEAEICCSKYGWLLMCRDHFTLFFFEPFNGIIIELPKFDERYATISFFHPPTSPECFIFGIAYDRSTLEIGMLRRGEDKWACHSYDNKLGFWVAICTPVLRHGFLYCLDVYGNIGKFNINGQFSGRSWKVYTNCLSPTRVYGVIKQQFLFRIQGKKMIFAVFVEHDERKISVFRLLEPGMKWELVENLGDKTLFVSQSASFAKTTTLKSMSNRIYFLILWKDKSAFYSLDTHKYHSFEDGYSNNTLHGFRELPFATWITPVPTLELPGQLPSWHTK